MPATVRYSRAAIETCRADFAAQVQSYRDLIAAASKASGASLTRIDGALATFEPGYFNTLLVALDARFAQRPRDGDADDGTAGPLDEVARLCAAIMTHGGVMTAADSTRPTSPTGVLGLEPGDRVALNADDFESICAAFLAAIEQRFLAA